MVRIVTDSTADVPSEWARELDILVVPAILTFGMEEFREGVDISTTEFYARLVRSPELPTTSQPSVGEFAEVYAKAAAGGHEVLGVHLGSTFSGLFEAARVATEVYPDLPVTLFDSGMVSMACGMLALEAARAAQRGATVGDIVAMLEDMRPRTRLLAALDTLEYIRRGGRLSRIGATLGRILSIRPVIQIYENQLDQLARTRYRENSLQRLIEIAESHSPFEHLYVMHASARATAEHLAERVAHLNSGQKPAIIEASSVVGTHAGPGAVGFALMSKR